MSSSAFKNAAALARPSAYHAPAPVAALTAPAGTFAAGTKIQVGTHKVVIDRYLSEGGFAHVYLVKPPQPINGSSVAVLKRVAVPDKEALANMRTEVETMKKLKGHRSIVTYIDSHASQLQGGGYEVFLLMEYCSGGGLIDFMNTRLQNRLTEPEVLKIFCDVAEGVACMHYLKPPLLHRDLKVENVLISSSNSSRRYKLCDFGSTAPPRPAANDATECRVIEEDVQKHTTLQYRSPEMIDVYRKQPIDEKSDIWALGVLLYKLCYYTTPFEEQGQLAILNASFKFPAYPSFSDRLKRLIASMLRENPNSRPNIFQVMREGCLMQGVEVPIKDIYAGRSRSEARRNQHLPSPEPAVTPPPVIGAVKAAPVVQQPIIPAIVPMRRGRPVTASQTPHSAAKPSPSPLRGRASDPFAALDSTRDPSSSATQDELSARFPTLDQFSLLHDSGSKFEFEQTSPTSPVQSNDINKRVTETLADEAFARPSVTEVKPKTGPAAAKKPREVPAKERVTDDAQHTQRSSDVQQVPQQRATMVSQGPMTSSAPGNVQEPPSRRYGSSTMHLKTSSSSEQRSSSQPRPSTADASRLKPVPADSRSTANQQSGPFLNSSHRSKSQTTILPLSASSARPSLEGKRPSSTDVNDLLNRPSSGHDRQRPSTVYLESDMDYLRGRESSQGRVSPTPAYGKAQYDAETLPAAITGESSDGQDTTITSNVDFLRAMEDQDGNRRKDKRGSSGSKSGKRSSMPSISLSSTKTLLAGRFGDAFRRFEGNTSGAPPPTSSPPQDDSRRELQVGGGPDMTGYRSEEEHSEDTETLTPEMKRELERRRLAQEERRVEAATADYRRKLADRDIANGRIGASSAGGLARATSIQNKVKTLLDENVKPSSAAPSTQYGQPADLERPSQARVPDESGRPFPPAPIRQKPVLLAYDGKTHSHFETNVEGPQYPPRSSSMVPNPRTSSRPNAPPKPNNLRRGQQDAGHGAQAGSNLQSGRPPLRAPNVGAQAEDWEADFSARYPSLSGLEMVETTIEQSRPMVVRSKEV